MDPIIVCRECSQGVSAGWTNQAPEFFWDKNGEIIEAPRDDIKEFNEIHAGHEQEKLLVVSGSWSKRPYLEPVKEEFFNVIGEKSGRRLVLRRWRDSIEKSAQYQVVLGRVKFWVDKIEIQTDEIKRQLEREKPEFARPETEWRVDLLIEAMQNILESEERFIKEELDLVFDELIEAGVIAATSHPLIFSCKLSDSFVWSLGHCLRCFFNNGERIFLEKFIERENVPEGALSLNVTFDFSV
jgi:hypothetical protein